jgi:hypothetical protein
MLPQAGELPPERWSDPDPVQYRSEVGTSGSLQTSMRPAGRKKFEMQGLQPAFLGPSAFASHIASRYERYARVIDDAAIKPE